MGHFDFIIVGGGTAGLPAAICAAERGAHVLLLEKTAQLGGTLPYAREMSAAGARQQCSKGIEDHPDWHLREVQQLAKGHENRELLSLAVKNAAETINWLETLGVRLEADTPKIVFNHEPYKIARTYFAEGGGSAVVDALRCRVEELVSTGLITLHYNSCVTSVSERGGVVCGVTYVDANGNDMTAKASSVLLATGGYAASQERYIAFHGVPQVMAWAPEHAIGDGLDLAAGLGAEVTGADCFNLSFGGVLEGDGPGRAIICRLNTLPQFRKPWEIIVNIRGERFIREDEPSIDAQEAALMRQPDYRGFMVFDEQMRRAAPDRIRKWYTETADDDFDAFDWFYSGETLAELAHVAGIDLNGLTATIASYNDGQSRGADALGREHMPVPFGEGPYYAIRFDGCNVISAAGIRSDGRLQALRADGTAISGLYLAGEILGHGQLMGKSAAGGMMATPAITFGRLVGERIPLGATPS